VRSIPEAKVLSVGTIHAAASAAQTPTATSFAKPHDGGEGGLASPPPGSRPAISPAPTPTTIAATMTGKRSKPPNVPTASETQINPTTPSTTSASLAGGPDQPGSSAARTR
jgi:hypothetical protein